ncbi:MAG: VWA domain-containing protein [Nanoarchaeota archaeon]|nr:VWA domain-containing protein [Nanoarchaeota archaeon]MBU1322423.1 VWA domain-containing protein [Nanoarchaeota archaeon]MBU1598172.1 VWA domain-containing protein [Nanoarchaeota archaeon]MBU2441421.1 VWA domain-containing protein [Nanoarchaeota archaeon]
MALAKNKKAFYFTLDALFASIILIGGLLLISQHLVKEHPKESIEYLSSDVLLVLSELQMSEVNSTFVGNYLDSSYTNLNISVLEQIGTYWAVNETELAMNLSSYILQGMFSNNTGVNIVIESDTIFEKTKSAVSERVSGERMITGIMQGAPLTGATSSAYLRKIDDKRTSSFAYFGGFVGQGNLSFFLEDIPDDVSSEDISMITLEVDAASSFTLKINSDTCDTFSPTSTNMSPDIWDITHCNSSIVPGRNNIYFIFSGEMNESYVAGGYLKVDYKTDEAQDTIVTGTEKSYLPGVEGVVNLYDSFYISGTLTNMSIYLHFDSTANRTYLTIGDVIVYQNDSDGETEVRLNDTDLHQFPINLNYDDLSNNTIPIRFASYNETQSYVFGSNADVVLITDLSGSMKFRMNTWVYPPGGNAIPGCKAEDIIDPASRRLGVAACLDSDVNAIIMNSSRANNYNRLWLVDFADNANPFFSSDLGILTEENIENEIYDRYKSKSGKEIKGGTCICCAINQAYDILNTYSSDNRTKSVIVMTDGVPTHCCGQYWDGNEWECNETSIGTTGYRPPSVLSCFGDEDDCEGNDCNGPMNNAINSAQRLHDDLNATVYAVGFGPLETCTNANYTVHEIAEAGNGSVLVSSDGSALQEFYQNISYDILSRVGQTAQIVTVQGNITSSILFNDSYIEFVYTPTINPPYPNELSVVVQTDQFGTCNPTVMIPDGIRVADAKVVSYSDYHWTDTLIIDGISVYNLSFFSSDYTRLGDPYTIQIPAYLLTNGTHSLTIGTGDSPQNDTNCSDNNTLIYTALVPSATARSEVVEHSDGCNWTIQFEDDTNSSKVIPIEYDGTKRCSYTENNYTLADGAYDNTDAYDIAVFQLLRALDFDDNGKVFVNLDAADIEIVLTTITSVPYLWGPTLIKARVWQ